MNKHIHHSWEIADGFKTHICIHCGLIRYWDNGFGKLMYKTKWKIHYFGIPSCKRTYFCDHIEKPELETIFGYKQTRHI